MRSELAHGFLTNFKAGPVPHTAVDADRHWPLAIPPHLHAPVARWDKRASARPFAQIHRMACNFTLDFPGLFLFCSDQLSNYGIHGGLLIHWAIVDWGKLDLSLLAINLASLVDIWYVVQAHFPCMNCVFNHVKTQRKASLIYIYIKKRKFLKFLHA